jgi:hypothetical protein
MVSEDEIGASGALRWRKGERVMRNDPVVEKEGRHGRSWPRSNRSGGGWFHDQSIAMLVDLFVPRERESHMSVCEECSNRRVRVQNRNSSAFLFSFSNHEHRFVTRAPQPHRLNTPLACPVSIGCELTSKVTVFGPIWTSSLCPTMPKTTLVSILLPFNAHSKPSTLCAPWETKSNPGGYNG